MNETRQWSPHGDAVTSVQSSHADLAAQPCGVRGWLKLFVVVNMYVAPVLFGILQVVGFIGVSKLAEDYPRILVIWVIESAVGVFLVVKWIVIARRLRDIVPGAVQEARVWLWVPFLWNVLSLPLVLMSGRDAEDPEVIKRLILSYIWFALWFSYFDASERVKATYPDWKR